jgi:hypothetical protein
MQWVPYPGSLKSDEKLRKEETQLNVLMQIMVMRYLSMALTTFSVIICMPAKSRTSS